MATGPNSMKNTPQRRRANQIGKEVKDMEYVIGIGVLIVIGLIVSAIILNNAMAH